MSPGSSKKANPETASNTKYNVGDVVLAKIRGFPAWPGIIMDDKNVPKAVLSERPVSKHRDLYTIRFFPAADYHWAASRDLSLLTPKQIEAYLEDPHKKSGELKEAYKIAQDPTEWNDAQNKIVENHERSLLDAAEEAEENQDQLQDDDEGQDDDVEPESKKRKRDGAATGKIRESASDKQRKKQKLAETKSKVKAGEPKAPSGGRKVANGEEAEEEVDPETKKVKDWRHKLQRAFLSKDSVLNADDMPTHDATFKVVESYDGMTSDQLKISKIGKVMKRIVLLQDIPRDDEFKFKERAQKLVEKWSTILNGEPSQDAPAPDTAKPAVLEPVTPALSSKPEETGTTADAVEDIKPSNDA